MYRRQVITALGVTAFSGCTGIPGLGSEVLLDEKFSSPVREQVEVESGETLSVTVTPLEPQYQLYMMMVEEDRVDDDESALGALSALQKVNNKVTREIEASEYTQYFVGVGWFEEPKQLESEQFHLKITVD